MPSEEPSPNWQPLDPVQRRVAGVLIEKAKTTPDAYPLSLNALTNGCNQKSNRWPQTNLTADDVAEALDQLRAMGAVAEIQGAGRVSKYRHKLYEWLGVDKLEIAVVAELLLRGQQTIGQLRSRASRMEPIADLEGLKPILKSLTDKRLVVPLTPEGRGQIVTHGLYPEDELEALKASIGTMAPRASTGATGAPGSMPVPNEPYDRICAELAELRDQVHRLGQRVERLEAGPPQR